MNESPGFNPVHCNPHHDLLIRVKHSLAECSSGDRSLLFETRERLHELTGRLGEGPWGMLSALTTTVETMMGHMLRRGSLEGPELMQVATDIVEFVDQCLTLAPPAGGTASVGGARLTLDGGGARSPRISRPSLRHEPLVTPEAQPQPAQGDGKRAADFGKVAYQMVNESRLGELLIKMGHITTTQLDRALVLQKLSRKRLGEVLMAMEAVDLEALQTALDYQRQETLKLTGGRVTPDKPKYGAAG